MSWWKLQVMHRFRARPEATDMARVHRPVTRRVSVVAGRKFSQAGDRFGSSETKVQPRKQRLQWNAPFLLRKKKVHSLAESEKQTRMCTNHLRLVVVLEAGSFFLQINLLWSKMLCFYFKWNMRSRCYRSHQNTLLKIKEIKPNSILQQNDLSVRQINLQFSI